MQQLSINQIYSGFKLESITSLDLLGVTVYSLEHTVTKAKMLHIDKDSSNNVFAVGFQTIPKDSTGIAHILEHTVLCGSKKFPVRDPFFSMLKRSMKTFMNAFTAPDWTLYPFATQNKNDFHNLMEVYLDSVFFPRLTKNSFLQEGHRLSFTNPNDMNSDLQIDGVVYNEMSGAMSNPSEVLYHTIYKNLFPTTNYRHNSGGDIESIPTLTHEDLIAFQKKYYHPTNALFYSYGNFPLVETLEKVNKSLSSFTTAETKYSVPLEQKITKPQTFKGVYAFDKAEDDQKKCQVCVSWVTAPLQEQDEVFTLQFIALVLLGHPGAPLYKALIDSKLGKSLCDTTGYDDETVQTVFSLGLQGVANEDIGKIESLVLTSLEQIVAQGISTTEIESALHQIELQLRTISENRFPYGLKMLLRFFSTWIHGGNPIEMLDIDNIIAILKQNLKKPSYLENKIKEYLLTNQHRVTIQLVPSHTLAEERATKLKTKLAKIKDQLSQQEKETLVQTHLTLLKEQEKQENTDCLPTLQVQDIPTKVTVNQAAISQANKQQVYFYDAKTNGIFYGHWIFYVSIPEELRLALPFMATVITESGAGEYNYETMSQQSQLYTSGFGAGSKLVKLIESVEPTYKEAFSISANSLNQNVDELFRLAKLLIESPRFDEIEHIQTILQRQLHHMETSVASNGHSYALLSATRGFSLYNRIQEQEQGISQIHYLRTLAKLSLKKLQLELQKIASILQLLLQQGQMTFIGIGDKSTFEEAQKALRTFKNQPASIDLQAPIFKDSNWQTQLQKEAWITTTNVSYVTQAFHAPSITHEDSPILFVVIQLLQSCFLHTEIREKGGAYGGMATFNPIGGYLGFLSYRDPHIKRTLNVYKEVITWFEKGSFTEQDCQEAILQTCSMLDKPMSLSGERLRDYWNEQINYTKEKREIFRQHILNCTKEEIQKVALRWFKANSSVSVVTNTNTFDKEKENISLSKRTV